METDFKFLLSLIVGAAAITLIAGLVLGSSNLDDDDDFSDYGV